MYVVLILLAIAAVIVLATWAAGFMKSKKMDVDQDAEQASEAMEAFRRRLESERLQTQGIRLRCMNCDHIFTGPMPETGCPKCHVASLVVAADRVPPQPITSAEPAAEAQTVGLVQPEDAHANRREA